MTERGESSDISKSEPESAPEQPVGSLPPKRSPHAWGKNQGPAKERSILKKFRSRKQNQTRPSSPLSEENISQTSDDAQ